jgi:hypothetical protein
MVRVCLSDRAQVFIQSTSQKTMRNILYAALAAVISVLAFLVGTVISAVFFRAVEL